MIIKKITRAKRIVRVYPNGFDEILRELLVVYSVVMKQSLIAKAWLASVPSVGPAAFAQLLSLTVSCDAYLSLTASKMMKLGISPKLVNSIIKHRSLHPPEVISNYCGTEKITIIDRDSQFYPKLLGQISDPPVVLYVKGNLNLVSKPSIAIVGTRKATPYGLEATRVFTKQLVEAGFVIVSGFMYGVDAQAHMCAIEEGGRTIGVLGFGFEHMYPESHRSLAKKMLANDETLITEYPYWQRPSAGSFPARNRIVSGMSLGVLVTEAAAKSGTKITARLAAEQGREVFAVPGPFNSEFSQGTKELVNLGAKLTTSIDDILEEIAI